MLDTGLVIIVLGGAMLYLGRRAYRSWTAIGSSTAHCSSCDSCPTKESLLK